mgnify:FL=1
MKSIYLYKAFFFFCAILFAFNLFELVDSQVFTFDTLFQTAILLIALFLGLFIRTSPLNKAMKPTL